MGRNGVISEEDTQAALAALAHTTVVLYEQTLKTDLLGIRLSFFWKCLARGVSIVFCMPV